MRRQATCAVSALLLHGLALRQERTWAPCLSAVWVARMSHSKAAVGTRCLPCPALRCAPPRPRACSAPFAPRRHLVSPCAALPCRGKWERVCWEQEGVSGSPALCQGHQASSVGVVGAGGTVCSLGSVHRPCVGSCGWHRSCTFPGRAYPAHAGVPVGLCPVGAAYPTAGNGLGMCWAGDVISPLRSHMAPSRLPCGSEQHVTGPRSCWWASLSLPVPLHLVPGFISIALTIFSARLQWQVWSDPAAIGGV